MSAPGNDDFLKDVHAGLSASPKRIPFQYFYDAAGAALFEEICRQPEYYPARVEGQIIDEHAASIAATIGPDAALVEFGSGDGAKTRTLLDALETPACYVPIDISSEQLAATAKALAGRYPALPVLPIEADFITPVALPERARAATRVVAFSPGLTFWNMELPDRHALLRRIRDMIGAAGALLIGVDLVKDRRMLEAAYDDAAGVTAAFNKNVLARINRELDGDLDLAAFEHRARWMAGAGRVEVALVSVRAQTATIGGRRFEFGAREPVITEYSYKFSPERFATMMAELGLDASRVWVDVDKTMCVHLMTCLR